MATQRYSVTPQPIETLLAFVKSGEIAIPELQRPFVWEATKVRNLLDSLYRGYPVGYLIVWRNPTVRLKDGRPFRQAHPHRRPAAGNGAHGGVAGPGGPDQGLRIRPHPHRLQCSGGEVRGLQPTFRRTARGSRMSPSCSRRMHDCCKSRGTMRQPIPASTRTRCSARWRSYARSSTTMSVSSNSPKTSISRR